MYNRSGEILLICFLPLGTFAYNRPSRDPSDDTLSLVCLCEVFIALLAAIILKYEVAFPEAAVGIGLTVSLLFPPVHP